MDIIHFQEARLRVDWGESREPPPGPARWRGCNLESAQPGAKFEIKQTRNSLKGVGGSFTARPWEAEIGVRVPEGPAQGFVKSRADEIMNFSNLPEGTIVTLTNFGPDEPFGGPPFLVVSRATRPVVVSPPASRW
jgi:hypothetical protein